MTDTDVRQELRRVQMMNEALVGAGRDVVAQRDALAARGHYTRRMLQALDAYWRCHDGHPGRRGRYDLEDWWTRFERYRALVEEQL